APPAAAPSSRRRPSARPASRPLRHGALPPPPLPCATGEPRSSRRSDGAKPPRLGTPLPWYGSPASHPHSDESRDTVRPPDGDPEGAVPGIPPRDRTGSTPPPRVERRSPSSSHPWRACSPTSSPARSTAHAPLATKDTSGDGGHPAGASALP